MLDRLLETEGRPEVVQINQSKEELLEEIRGFAADAL